MKSSKSSLFLMELIISILFFSLSSAACIQLFVKAHVLDTRTREQNQTVIWSQNLASLWQAEDGDLNTVYKQLITDYSVNREAFLMSSDQVSLTILFDHDFNLLTESAETSDLSKTAYYQVLLTDLKADPDISLQNAEMLFKRMDEVFYTLPLCHHTASERGNLNE